MIQVNEKRGTVIIIILAIMLGILMGLFVPDFPAEAIMGGLGNVTTSDNPHNFSAGSQGVAATDPAMTQICVFCHTPHHAITGDALLLNAPLWNHKLSSTLSYTVKTPPGPMGNMISAPPSLPDGASKLCLSCHDGTVGVGEVSYAAGIAPPNAIQVSGACVDANGKIIWDPVNCPDLGGISHTDLSSHHIVSVPVNDLLKAADAAACPGSQGPVDYPWNLGAGTTIFLRPTAQTYSGSPGISGDSVPAGAWSPRYKSGYNYGVQCSSCHDPHLWTNTSGTYDPNVVGSRFIVDSFNNVCTGCHYNCP